MRILYLITGLGLGGAERVVVDLANKIYLKGNIVKIVYLKGNVIVRPNNNIEIIGLDFENISEFFKASKKYREVISDFKPDIVHAHMIHANIFARLNRIKFQIPRLICSAHNSNEGGKIRMLAYRFTNFLSNLNTNVSREASQALIEKGAFKEKDIITVYNGIDLNKFKKESVSVLKFNEETVFLSVGRFNDQKDYPNLFKAIHIIKNKINKKIKFYIAGDGELRTDLEQLIIDLDILDCISLLGSRSDISDLLNKADYFILSSKHEGLPTVIIEAMACETFVIATDCGGSAEIMGGTGILVPPQDSEALAQALNDAINKTPEEIQENNSKASQRVKELFSLEKSVKTWLNLYEQK